MKAIFAVRGVGNRGKTTSIKLVYELLQQKYPEAVPNEIFIGKDISVIMQIGSIKIGIESHGDPNTRLLKRLRLFAEEGCEIIVCATRSTGQTEDAVNKFARDYQINWFDKPNEPKIEQQEAANNAFARQIFSEVQKAIIAKHRIPAET